MKTNKKLFYNSIAKEFDEVMNYYDLKKRLDVFFHELLIDKEIKQKKLLDAGCGTGWFSQKAVAIGAKVTSLDVGKELLNEVSKKCKSKRVLGSITELPFKKNTFDYVISSEVIEHVPDPKQAISEMYRVLKPGGILILSTPNKFWYWSVVIANKLKIRPYQGLENWLTWQNLESSLTKTGFKIKKMVGIHMFPFQLSIFHKLLDIFHYFSDREPLKRYMVNIAVRCQKPK